MGHVDILSRNVLAELLEIPQLELTVDPTRRQNVTAATERQTVNRGGVSGEGGQQMTVGQIPDQHATVRSPRGQVPATRGKGQTVNRCLVARH